MSKIQLLLTALTDVGCIRKNNEDNFIVCQNLTKDDWFMPQEGAEPFVLGEKGSIMVVADGMGGMNAGEVASDIAVKTVKEFFAPDKLSDEIVNKPENRCQYLKQVIVEADNRIKAKSKSDPETEGMGTTIVISWAIGQETHIAWCGDSRAYSYHPNSGLRQLSKDHSYVQELVDSGKLLPELAFDHPDSNIITSSLGDLSKPAAPDIVTTPLHEGEIILLCSDGLCGMLRDSEMQQVLDAYYPDLSQCKKNLIEGALNAGGHDNVTLTMTMVTKGGDKMPMKKDTPIVNSVNPTGDNTAPAANPNKKRTLVLGGVIVALLVIIALLGLKLAQNKDANTEEPGQVLVDSTGTVKQDSQIAPPKDTVKKEEAPSPIQKAKRILKDKESADKAQPSNKNDDGDINATPNPSLNKIEKKDDVANPQTENHPESQNN